MDKVIKQKVDITENARTVLERRYLKKDSEGLPVESVEDMLFRVAKTLAAPDLGYDKDADVEKLAEEFYEMMARFEFMPNSPTLMNAGRVLGQLSACFVLPIEDSMESIFETVKNAALIHKSGGGTGFRFSRLRGNNSAVKSTGGVASGPVSFMKVFDAATQAVKQGGTRRGANMGILRVDHPDVLEFLGCKSKDKEISNFNISIGLTEEFMKKAEAGEDYDTIDPHTGKKVGSLNAKEVFNSITEMAYKNGEPGIVFLDRINRYNPTPAQGEIEATNPCGEQPLLPYESCNLGSINLSKMVVDGAIDWERLEEVTRRGVHFLDNVIDANNFPLTKIAETTRRNRKIGLGVMGFADMLIKMDIAYNSQEGLDQAEKVMSFIHEKATAMSVELAEKRGLPGAFNESIYNSPGKPKLRNMTLTTIAPTGTISIISDCSSGVEPLFAVAYYRNVMDNDKLTEFNPYFESVAFARGFDSEDIMKKVAEKGKIGDIEGIPDDIKKIFVTAHDISPEWHIKMQAAFQKYTDNAVSKTINFPEHATIEEVRKAYKLAYELGCKGLTIYRDNSRGEQVLNIAKEKKENIEEIKHAEHIAPRERPNVVKGTTTKVNTGCGNLYVTINEDSDGEPFEVFMQMGKAGGCAMSQLESIGRLVSLALRSGVEVDSIIEQIKGIRCPAPAWGKGGKVLSCSDAIAKALEQKVHRELDVQPQGTETEQQNDIEEIKANMPPVKPKKRSSNIVGVCPDCGEGLQHIEGCMVCRGCGYSKCG
ncbi:MAG: vitamin B12-dependent ribonucleotide reductase [Candidatus Omnitrophica bacterium]|nr:vitamin B12-dependent ribonucleotide reductase [Candidatus Omnitrophota bacterium]